MNFKILYILPIFYMLVISSSFSQSARWQTKNYIIQIDSVTVQNSAVFTRFKFQDQKEEQDAVKFTLTIKNNSNHLIPDIQTARYNQPGGLKIFINGYDAMQMTLANGVFGGDKTLKQGDSDSWEMNEQLTGEYAVNFGDVFTWQWEYMGIRSPIIQVDVNTRIIQEVKVHVKSDKVIY